MTTFAEAGESWYALRDLDTDTLIGDSPPPVARRSPRGVRLIGALPGHARMAMSPLVSGGTAGNVRQVADRTADSATKRGKKDCT